MTSPESREPELSFDTKLDGISGLIVGFIGSLKGREVCRPTLYVMYTYVQCSTYLHFTYDMNNDERSSNNNICGDVL